MDLDNTLACFCSFLSGSCDIGNNFFKRYSLWPYILSQQKLDVFDPSNTPTLFDSLSLMLNTRGSIMDCLKNANIKSFSLLDGSLTPCFRCFLTLFVK